ncbi:hypothetical protein CDD80_7121 [Ophiocordyceps camponoti-rufipedis]|uniref:Aminoglycoside phosphotransferase domain-containing protein n=1 Tax=Ophiocordyceps camponoti-rufipedis TaxID=2004952 RepID=A0A2C5YPJ6_9HYPO|nr:hypothetical protein CDD80_7121 [Ophiocordyceps camponoti-rufipedis]
MDQAENLPDAGSDESMAFQPIHPTAGRISENRFPSIASPRQRLDCRDPPVFPGGEADDLLNTFSMMHLDTEYQPSTVPAQSPRVADLAALVNGRRLRYHLEAPPNDDSLWVDKAYSRWITDAGLLMNETIFHLGNVPVLRLPKPFDLDGERSIDRNSSGRLLEDIWSGLSQESKFKIVSHLGEIITEMRNTAQPEEVNGRPVAGSHFSGDFSLLLDKSGEMTTWAVRTNPSYADFTAFLFHSFRPAVADRVRTAVATAFQPTGRLVLTHGELSPRNIIVHGDTVEAIIGWNAAGWYPDWWEYAKFFEATTSPENRDWYRHAEFILSTRFDKQLSAFYAIRGCQEQFD